MKLKEFIRLGGSCDFETFLDDFIPNTLLKSETLQQAFDISPFEMEQFYADAYNLYEKDEYGEAAVAFRWLVLLNTFEPKYWLGFGACQQILGLWEKALHSYAMASLLEDANPYPHFYAWQCYTALKEPVEAKKAWVLARERARRSPIIHKKLCKELEEAPYDLSRTP